MPPISDQITVRPVARFGTPSTISLPDAIFRRLDQIGTDTRLARLEARLQAAEAGSRTSQLSDRVYEEAQRLSRQLYEYSVLAPGRSAASPMPRRFLSRARSALFRLAGK